MIFLATTTINKPTLALRKFAKNNNCKLIVALDKKSKEFNLKNTFVLSTNYQEKKWPKLSNLIGWNCIQRRNFAILEALERGAQIIGLVDDDNIPYNNINSIGKQWIRRFALALSKEVLGQVRSKFGAIPIPGESVTLNGEALITQGKEEQDKLRTELKEILADMEYMDLIKADAELVEATAKIFNAAPLPIFVG